MFTAFGWSASKSRDYYSETDHKDETRLTDNENEVVSVKTYQGIKTAILSFIKDGREKCYLNVSDYEGNVSDAVSEASLEIVHNTALGVYAVENITHSYTKESQYFNVVMDIYYKHTKEQVRSIAYLNYVSAVQGALGKAISDHKEYLVISISSAQVTQDYIRAYALEYYRANPLEVTAPPEIKTIVHAAKEQTKIIEIELSYPNTLPQEIEMRTKLQSTANLLLKNAKSSKDVATAANACKRLIESSDYVQSGSPTAYGTLIERTGNSEGFAMAYKIFCSVLGIKCTVVEGALGGDRHFWNIIELGGECYHADPAVCGLAGMSAAFLKTDAEFRAMGYRWDTSKYKPCNGNLKYESLENG